MKKLFLILIIVALWKSVEAQTWNLAAVGTVENLNKVYFVNDYKGFIVGNNGLLLKTSNGGDSWETVPLNVQHHLKTISFASEEAGFINGLRTTDGGTTWIPQASSEIYGFMYANSENRILAGHGDSFDGKIYESTDGGDSWHSIYNFGNLSMFNDGDFISQALGYFSSWYAGHLFKTTDSGNSWNEIIINEVDGNPWSSDDYRSVDFQSQEIGLLTHQSGVLKTVDGANTWSEIKPAGLNVSFYPQSIIAISATNYILVGSTNTTQLQKIYETTDGGNTWIASANTLENISDVACSSTYCFAVGSNGTVYRKENLVNNIEESVADAIISIFPNPSNDVLNVVYKKEIAEVNIYNVDGKLNKSFTNSNGVIQIGQLNSGSYLIEITTADGSKITSKFIKN